MKKKVHLEEFQQDYIAGIFYQLDTIEDNLLLIEKEYSIKTLEAIKAQIHSIKGTAGSYGFDFASTLTHKFEDLLENIDDIQAFQKKVSFFLKFIDLLKEYFRGIITGNLEASR